jgi:DNA polymerase-3 subunit chi
MADSVLQELFVLFRNISPVDDGLNVLIVFVSFLCCHTDSLNPIIVFFLKAFSMTKVYFYTLQKPEKALQLCLLAQNYLLQGVRVLISVDDENQGVTLDRFMWSWDKESFVPHVYDNGAVDCLDEPVVIVSREANPNGAQVLIMGRPLSLAFISRFETVVDFAELYREEAKVASRQRYVRYREAGFEPRMMELSSTS